MSVKPPTALELIERLNLKPHPREGGFYVETYRSGSAHETPHGDRNHSTAIYYLLTPHTRSELHRLRHDEIFHFYTGDPVEQLQLFPDGSGKIVTIGNRLHEDETPQVVVPAGVWQGARLRPEGPGHYGYALMGATMAPGFDFLDYEHGDRKKLVAEYPEWREWIERLTG